MTHQDEWIKKAFDDLGCAKLIIDSNKEYFNQICFLSQQAIEKLLKAYLIKKSQSISKTHDLTKLTTDCSNFDKAFEEWKNVSLILTTYSVDFRYPGEEATKEEALESYKLANDYSKVILQKLQS